MKLLSAMLASLVAVVVLLVIGCKTHNEKKEETAPEAAATSKPEVVYYFKLPHAPRYGEGNFATSRPEKDDYFKRTLDSLPPRIRTLTVEIQGVPPEFVRPVMVEMFGYPNRTSGSGRLFEHWDIEEGELILCDRRGYPTFASTSGKSFYLVRTSNPLEENLKAHWEMSTLPDPDHYGNRTWTGVLALDPTGTFTFRPENTYWLNDREKLAQEHDFFAVHRIGTYTVTYLNGFGPTTLLEEIPAGRIAKLTFKAGDSSAVISYFVRREQWNLSFESDSAMEFTMYRPWSNWGYPPD